jgi:hypothetical protein
VKVAAMLLMKNRIIFVEGCTQEVIQTEGFEPVK